MGTVLVVAAAIVLLGTYVLLSLPRFVIRGRRITRPIIAVAGGALMIGVGAVSPSSAVRSVDLGTLELLLGMMLLVAALEIAGFFELCAKTIVNLAQNQRSFLILVMGTVAVLSAFLLNDAVVLLFTPILLEAARRMDISPMPYLAGEAVAANIGSVATPIGNPQNAYVALHGGLTFVAFARALGPLALASLLLALGAALIFFRSELSKPIAARPPDRARAAHPWLLAAVIAVVLATLATFLAAPGSLAHVALAGGVLASTLATAVQVTEHDLRRPSFLASWVPRRVNWGVLVFFVGLFVLLGGVANSGLLAQLLDWAAPLAISTPVGIGAVVAILSNLVSNVPAVVLLSHPGLTREAWLSLAGLSTVAGNATFLGAAANVIVAEQARARGHEFNVLRFIAFGLPLAILTITIGLGFAALGWPA
ncbi:MAG: ArsB/NhaD family transporter [Thermoplasmatota archaeon]